MDNGIKTPVLPMGLFRIESAVQNYSTTLEAKCTECKVQHKAVRPFLEVSRSHMCVAFVCPACGANNPLVFGAVQRVTCVSQSDPEPT